MVLIVAAVIERNGRFLLARRAAHKADAGYWEFPGGKVEADETPQATLARELTEELQVKATIGELLLTGRDQGMDFQAFAARIGDAEPSLQDHDRLEWLQPGEFAGFPMHAFDLEVARLLGKSLG